MTDIAVFTVTWAARRTGQVSVEMFASDAQAWTRCCALAGAGIDAQLAQQGIEVLR